MAFYDWFGGLFIDKENAARGDAASRQLELMNQAELGAGTITQSEYEQRDGRLEASMTQAMLLNPELSPAEGFEEGLAEGFENVVSAPGRAIGFVGDTSSRIMSGVLKNIPWWWYVGGGLVVGLWLYFNFFRRRI